MDDEQKKPLSPEAERALAETNDPAYLALFGGGQGDTANKPQVALYHHHHDHQHDAHGNVVKGTVGCSDSCEHDHHA